MTSVFKKQSDKKRKSQMKKSFIYDMIDVIFREIFSGQKKEEKGNKI